MSYGQPLPLDMFLTHYSGHWPGGTAFGVFGLPLNGVELLPEEGARESVTGASVFLDSWSLDRASVLRWGLVGEREPLISWS